MLDRRRFLLGLAGAGLAGATGACTAGGGGDRSSATTTIAPSTADAAEGSREAAPGSDPAATPTHDGYVPPSSEEGWERVDPADAGWEAAGIDAVLALAEARNSNAVVWLAGGRLLAEGRWEVAPDWRRDIASAQKGVVAVLCAVAAQRGLLELDEPVSTYLGAGWTAEPDRALEARITVRHLMGMTSGLGPDLRVAADPGTVWWYHNDAYHQLHAVLEAAAGSSLQALSDDWLFGPTGMRATWRSRTGAGFGARDVRGGPLTGLVTDARSLARFALLVQRRGRWGPTAIVEPAGVDELLRPSSELNPSYGLLWWLNGQPAFRAPGTDPPLRPGPIFPSGPPDAVAALGAHDQKAYVLPSFDSCLTRLGASAEGRPAALSGFDDELLGLVAAARTA